MVRADSHYLTDAELAQSSRSWPLSRPTIFDVPADVDLPESGTAVVLFSIEFDPVGSTYMP